jgi:multidrug efflux pump subunit AcrB
MAHRTDDELIRSTRNTERFFVETRSISWLLLVGVCVWGILGYSRMPKRKDPVIPVREAVAVCAWPGVDAKKVEQLVTRKIEQKIAENSYIHPAGAGTDYGIASVTLDGETMVYVQLAENVPDPEEQFDDIDTKLKSIDDLPQGAGPIQFLSDFGDTAALMLTVASPKVSEVEVALHAREIRSAIEGARETASPDAMARRVSMVTLFPQAIGTNNVLRVRDGLVQFLIARGLATDVRKIDGNGFAGLDANVVQGVDLQKVTRKFILDRVGASVFPAIHPDAWAPVLIRDPADTESALRANAGDKYTYRQLERYTDLIQRALHGLPAVQKISRSGILPEWVQLAFSQRRLASYGVTPAQIAQALSGRNIPASGGSIDAEGTEVTMRPTGEFSSESEIGDVMVGTAHSGAHVYLRDLVDILRGYQNPPQLLNFYTWRGPDGQWHRSRAITLAIFMRPGEQIGPFGESIDQALDGLKQHLPEDLIIARTSDQPRQVRENLEMLNQALYEAIFLVILVAWVGFWEWRSALLVALSIPITLAMTFGMMNALGIDLQQMSIATLIIALGLLVDDPVVAGDAIKHELGMGRPAEIAAWLGPTKLERAILFGTITNVAAYLPFLLLTGNTGKFLYSLPIVMTCALVSSRIVSMTFIPLLGYYLMRPGKPLGSMEYRRTHGFTGMYFRVGRFALEHRKAIVGWSFAFLAGGFVVGSHLSSVFFPDDVQYLSYVDIWLPNGSALSQTSMVAKEAEEVVERVASQYATEIPDRDGKPAKVLKSVTSFVGGNGPHFWFTAGSQPEQPNYARLILETYDKRIMPDLVVRLQTALSNSVPGAYMDVRQLLINPVSNPIELHVSGQVDLDPSLEDADIKTLTSLANQIQEILRTTPGARRVRSDWLQESPSIRLPVNSDRAILAGITNADVARSATTGLNGSQLGTLNDGDLAIPIMARLRQEERSQLQDIGDLYIYALEGNNRIPLTLLAPMVFQMSQQRIVRRDHFRTVTVVAFPAPGVLPSEIMAKAMPKIEELRSSLPPGYRIDIGGEQLKQTSGFSQLAIILGISIALIFTALVAQFHSLVKPWLVFAAVPYGIVGAFGALAITRTPFGFMAFLGITSLVGVIVSHVIVLFEFIEQRQELGEPLVQGLLDAGIERLRPVMVTVGATLLALIPLAIHGGPLWRPLCFAQIGGLSLATVIELVLVKSFYVIFVADLGILKWGPRETPHEIELPIR